MLCWRDTVERLSPQIRARDCAFLDLGVAQRVGAARGAPRHADARITAQAERMHKAAQLALPWEARVRALAATGVPAMLYGACTSRPGAAALRGARRAALHVAFRACLRIAPDALGCLAGLLWRANPAAIVAIAPWRPSGASIAQGRPPQVASPTRSWGRTALRD